MFRTVRQPLFEAEGNGGGESAESGQAASSNLEGFNPTWGLPSTNQAAASNPLSSPEAAQPVAVVPDQPAPTNGQVFDFAGRKIEVLDPSIAAALKDVHKDYTALTGTYTQTNQRVKELEQANQTYMNLLQQQMQQQQAAQPNAAQPDQQNQPQQPTAEELQQLRSEFQERFYDDPLTAIEDRVGQMLESMFQQKVQPVIEPITQERQWNEQIQSLQQKYPEDFPQLIGQMQELIQEMPHLVDHGLEAVLQLAKRSQPAPQPQPEQLLNNPEFMQQMLQKPEIQQQFLTQYMQTKQAAQQQAPTLIGGQPGGQAPLSPEDRPKDIRSATQAFRRSLGIF